MISKAAEQLTKYQGWAALPLRAMLAASFIAHGRPKVYGSSTDAKFGAGVADVAELLRAQGTPAPRLMAWVVTLVEYGGGFALALGFCTRLVALLLAFTMLVAIVQVKFKQGFVGGYEYDLSLLAACFALAISGGGPLSLDRALRLP